MNANTDTQVKKGKTVPAESWEIETVQRQFPQFSEQDIKLALEECKREMGDQTAHEKMMRCVESKLK